MDLTPDQIRAARACGCILTPATENQVGRLSMQRRVFTLDGVSVVVERNGFFETHGTLAALISQHQRSVPTAGGVPNHSAPAAATPPARAVMAPPVKAPAAVDILLADVVALAPAEPTVATPEKTMPRRPPAKPRKRKAPCMGPAVADAEVSPGIADAVKVEEVEEVAVEAVGDDIAPPSAGAAANDASDMRAAGRPRLGQAAPRWKIAGKLRRGRPT